MPMCAVFGCCKTQGRNTLEDDGLTPLHFFTFPNKEKEPTRFNAWVHFCGRKDISPAENKKKVICSRHFIPSDIIGNRLLHGKLKSSAIPSEKLPSSSALNDRTFVNEFAGPSKLGQHVNDTGNATEVISEDPVGEIAHLHPIKDQHAYDNVAGVTSEDPVEEIVGLHPIKDIGLHKPKWVFYNNDKIVWYLKLSVASDMTPEIVQSVNVNTVSMEIQFFDHGILLQPREISCIMMNLQVNILEDFVQMLDNFENFNTKQNVLLSLASKVKHAHYIYNEKLNSNSEDDDDNEDCNLLFVHEQIKMLAANPTARRWNPSMLRWAMLIHYHSPAAYRAIIQSGYILLPTERTLSKYYASMKAETGLPGEHKERLEKAITSLTQKDRHFQLIIDEMQIRPEASFDGQSLSGFAMNSDEPVLANKILTYLIQSLCGHFRDVVAFFPVKNITAKEMKTWTDGVINVVEECGGKVEGITMDNAKINQTMGKMYGIFQSENSVTASVQHPYDKNRLLTIIVDPCHLMKCMRNNWLKEFSFQLPDGFARFHFVVKMWEMEINSQHKLARNLSERAVHPTVQQKQSVRLAINVISPTTTAALEYRHASQSLEFKGAEVTIDFMKKFYSLWCWMNVQYPRQGICERNNDCLPFTNPSDDRLDKMNDFIKWLRLWNVHENEHKLSSDTFRGFLFTLQGLQDLIRRLLSFPYVDYVLTGKFQQDSLEERFGAHRLRAGCSYNPSVLQFCQTERKLNTLKYQVVSKSCNTNRENRAPKKMKWDETKIVGGANTNVSQQCKNRIQQLQNVCNEVEHDYSVSNDSEDAVVASLISTLLKDVDLPLDCENAMSIPHDELEVIYFLAGFISYKSNTWNEQICKTCRDILCCKSDTQYTGNSNWKYFSYLDRGGLSRPSAFLLKVIEELYIIFRDASRNKYFTKVKCQLVVLFVVTEEKAKISCILKEFDKMCHGKTVMRNIVRIYFRICLRRYVSHLQPKILGERKLNILSSGI